jgi:hypothetical protein
MFHYVDFFTSSLLRGFRLLLGIWSSPEDGQDHARLRHKGRSQGLSLAWPDMLANRAFDWPESEKPIPTSLETALQRATCQGATAFSRGRVTGAQRP